jgi:hypothetical protein
VRISKYSTGVLTAGIFYSPHSLAYITNARFATSIHVVLQDVTNCSFLLALRLAISNILMHSVPFDGFQKKAPLARRGALKSMGFKATFP